jgi:hypothetical protein
MTHPLENLVAAAKVIPAGSTGDGRLRATVMLTPAYKEGKDLANWPTQVIAWLKSQEWQVELGVEPVIYRKEQNTCSPPPSGKCSASIKACAAGARLAWGTGATAWVQDLWKEAFIIDGKGPDWDKLAKLIEHSTQGAAMQSAADKPALHKNDEGKSRVTAGNDSAVKVQSILPSRQTDLALLIECRRALELSDTLWQSVEKSQALIDREVECALATQLPGRTESQKDYVLDVSKLFDHAIRREALVKREVEESYGTGIVCDGIPTLPLPAVASPSSLSTSNREELELLARPAINSHQAANIRQMRREDENSNPPAQDTVLIEHLNQRYFYIQGSPAQSRLFGLAVDVYFSAQELDEKLFAKRGDAWAADGTGFLYLALNDSSLCRSDLDCVIFTLAKFRLDVTQPHFWPASRAEIRLGPHATALQRENLSQYEGIVVMGQRVGTDSGGLVPRFDFSSLDVRAAAEGEVDRREARPDEDDLRQQVTNSGPATRPALVARKTLRTAGITLLDRGRQDQAVAQLAARTVHQKELLNKWSGARLLLDAEDLTLGYRIDIGVPVRGDDEHQWRPLMAREIVHGTSGTHAALVKTAIPLLFQDGGCDSTTDRRDRDSEWRRRLEDAVLALPARLVPREDTAPGADATDAVDAFVEEAIAVWTGEPMSVQTSGKRVDKVQAIQGMPTGSVIKLPTRRQSSDRRPFKLRFGYPYRFGMRAVYPGGISIALDMAKRQYNQDGGHFSLHGGALTIPGALGVADARDGVSRPRDQLKRFLRQERIEAPSLLLLKATALHRNGEMGYERAAHAIVRTVRSPVASNRAQPTITQRVFVVPSVSLSFAGLHGVFDGADAAEPPGGLRSPLFGAGGVRFDANGGGFPVATSEAIIGINGARFEGVRTISSDTHTHTGDLVYAVERDTRPRKIQYYPDPAVDSYAIGVRYAGTDTYLEGSCVIPAYAKGRSHPNARPLVLTICRSNNPRRTPRPKLKDVLTWSESRLAANAGLPRTPGSVEAVFELAPGEDFEVDVWCIPSAGGMAKLFAVVDAMGTLAIARARMKVTSGNSKAIPSRQDVSAALRELLPPPACDVADQCLPDGDLFDSAISDWMEGYAGLGGLPGPGMKTLLAISRGIHSQLRERPLDEISAVRTMRATHAIDQPHMAPIFALPATSSLANAHPPRPVKIQRTNRIQGDTISVQGPTISATGDVVFHLPTTGSLEIQAAMVSPSSNAFDDLRRGRALRDRRTGLWPKTHDEKPLSPFEVFGFNVNRLGEANFEQTKVVLQRLDNIPLAPARKRLPSDPQEPFKFEMDDEGRCLLPLEEIFGKWELKDGVGTSKLPFHFTDELARLLCLQVVAYPRHAEQMRTASPPARDGYWLREGKDLDPTKSGLSSEVVTAWRPAGVRPAEPNALAPMPAFVWQRPKPSATLSGESLVRVTRRSVVRIPLARPWLSSGENEKLGIVIWPPNLHRQDLVSFLNDVIELPPVDSMETPGIVGRKVNLADFMDEDLGPGGKFVTRWGGDPIRPPAPARELQPDGSYRTVDYKRTFVPAEAFVDLDPQTRLGFAADFVEGVKMPVRLTGESETTTPPTLEVSIIAYSPRFDLELEQWYVDVGIEHDHEAEPFVRLGLVRYQANTEEQLRVSYPVIQWAQLLPTRHIEVRTSTTHKGKTVCVKVAGLALLPAPSPDSPETEREPLVRMTARVFREHHLDSGALVRHEVCKVALKQPTLFEPETWDSYRAVWEHVFEPIPANPLDREECASYYVFIEEREARLPATYPNEPVSPLLALGRDCKREPDDQLLVEAGPRFLARVDI